MSEPSIEVSLYDYRPYDEIKRGRLQLLCGGKDCNEQFINGLGRIAVDYVPTYAFAKDLIKIEKTNHMTGYHDSVPFNFDMMRDRLKNMPVIGVDPGISVLHEKYWRDVDYLDPQREVHESEKRVEMSIDVRNSAPEEDSEAILHVTTNDAKIYVDNALTEIYSKDYPMLLISLKPKEAFKCSLRAVLGVGLNDSSWMACTNFYFDQETVPDKIIAKFEGTAQFDEFALVERAIECYRTRAIMLKDEVHRLYLASNEQTDRFVIVINDEDHTMGEPINYEIQSHKDVLKSSVSRPDLLVRKIVIDVLAKNPAKMLDAILDSFDNFIAKINKFEKEFKKIDQGKKGTAKTKAEKLEKSEKTEKTEKKSKKDSKSKK